MAERNRHNVQQSVLDRLIDREPGTSHESVQRQTGSIAQVKAGVVRDLENLLNTKRIILDPPDSYEELENSLYRYGLGDFTSQNPKSPAVRQHLRQEIEKTIALCEPRLRNVTVQFETGDKLDRFLRFRIVGLLVVDPISEPVTFDTYFDVNRGEYVITK
ncbi:MAG: type VI secretion system baseplate subunit TssE [Chloroflexota bacterium]